MTTVKTPKPKIIKDKDYVLVQAINSGQYGLFHDLVKRYELKLYTFSLRMYRNPSDAEDMVQETFLNVFRYLKDFRYETKFKNWLYRIAASTCIKKGANLNLHLNANYHHLDDLFCETVIFPTLKDPG